MAKELNILLILNNNQGGVIKDGINSLKDIKTRLRTCQLPEGWNSIVENKPNVVICLIEDNYDTYLQLIKKTKTYYHGIDIIVLSNNTDSDYILESFKCGIHDYLKTPYNIEELKASLKSIYEGVNDNKKYTSTSKVISVFSNKGGIGGTTVASNLAVSLAEIKEVKVLLCDFVFQHGDVAIFLDTKVKYSINEIITNMNRIDKVFLENSLSKTKEGLYIINSPERPEDCDYINTKHLIEIIQILKTYFDYIVIDTSHDYDDNTITILDNTDIILLLLTLELPSICNCGKTLEVFQKLRYERDKVKLIGNRTNARNQIDVKLVEEQLHYPIFYQLPNDYATVVKAINNGKSIFEIARNSSISSSIRGLRDELLKDINKRFPEDKKGIFSHIFKK